MDRTIGPIVGTAIIDLRPVMDPTRMQKASCLGLSMAAKLYNAQQARQLYRRQTAVHKSPAAICGSKDVTIPTVPLPNHN